MVSPTSPGGPDLRQRDHRLSFDSPQNGQGFGGAEQADHSSRRESVDSRINQGFGEMRLGNSPYGSVNQSTASIQSTLQQQRNPRPAQLDSLSIHRISNGYQPSQERNPEPHHKVVRTAPAITGPATSTIARAAEPTKGQAWAFPEEEIQRLPSAASQSLIDSRRSSVAESLASSQFTSESRLPPGQRHLDDGLGPTDRYSSVSADFPAVHHHTLQHKQIGDLQSEVAGLQTGSQPYSRTPELRRSHKLAERKRRTEMKELFEELRDLMPQERGSKASKWEILTKGTQKPASRPPAAVSVLNRCVIGPRPCGWVRWGRTLLTNTPPSHCRTQEAIGDHQGLACEQRRPAPGSRCDAPRAARTAVREHADAKRLGIDQFRPRACKFPSACRPVRARAASATRAAPAEGLERRPAQRARIHDRRAVRASQGQWVQALIRRGQYTSLYASTLTSSRRESTLCSLSPIPVVSMV